MTVYSEIKNKHHLMIYSEQVEQLYKAFMSTIYATFGMAVLLILTQWQVIEHGVLLGWLLVLVVVTLLRAVLVYFYKRKKPAAEESHYWGRLFIAGTALAGVTWGMASILFFPENDLEHQIIVLLVVHGMSAGAVTSLSVVRYTVYVFILPAILPIIPLLIFIGSDLSMIIVAMVLLSVAFLIKSSSIFFHNMRDNIQLRFAATEKEASLILAKEQADKASQAKSDFLSSMSHELRTPMNAILGFAQLLEYDEQLNNEQQDSVDEILIAGNHLLKLINEVLDLAKIESGSINLLLEPVELTPLVDESIKLIAPMAEIHEISISHSSMAGFYVHADRIRLKQVLLNLLTNAIKYNHKAGRIEVECRVINQDKIQIAIRDNGKGVAEERIEELFQPFNRLDAHNSTIEGTGIGLTITRNLVEMMGGCIGVTSQAGIGSCFWVELTMDTDLSQGNILI